MKIKSRFKEDTLIIEIYGAISGAQAISLDKDVIAIMEQSKPKRMIVDYRDVEFIDSTGIGAMITLRQYSLKNKILFATVHVNEKIRNTLSIANVEIFFNVKDESENLI